MTRNETKRFYKGFGNSKAEAFDRAMINALIYGEPDSVIDMLLDCYNILKGENDFIHAVEVEYTRLIPENTGYLYMCEFNVEKL